MSRSTVTPQIAVLIASSSARTAPEPIELAESSAHILLYRCGNAQREYNRFVRKLDHSYHGRRVSKGRSRRLRLLQRQSIVSLVGHEARRSFRDE